MSRTIIANRRIATWAAVIALLAVWLVLLSRTTVAQDLFVIAPGDVQIVEGTSRDGVYIPVPYGVQVYQKHEAQPSIFQLLLGRDHPLGRIRVNAGASLTFSQRATEMLLEIRDGVPPGTYAGTLTETNDGGAVFIDDGTRYQFSASSNARTFDTTLGRWVGAFNFSHNTTLGSGGAIFIRANPPPPSIPDGINLDLINIYFDNNVAEGSRGGNLRGGGALFNEMSTVNLRQVYFDGNESRGSSGFGIQSGSGGAIYNLEGLMVFTARATFTSALPANHNPTWATPTWEGTQSNWTHTSTGTTSPGNVTISGNGASYATARTGGPNNNSITHYLDHPASNQFIGRFITDRVLNYIEVPGDEPTNVLPGERINENYFLSAVIPDGIHTPILDNIDTFINNYTANTFVYNRANEDGGAIFNNAGTLRFPTDATSGAVAAVSNPRAISNNGGTNTVPIATLVWAESYRRTESRAAIFYSNTADFSGGAIYTVDGTLDFTNRAMLASITTDGVPANARVNARALAHATGAGHFALAHRSSTSLNPIVADTGALSYMGIFVDNRATLYGGAIYYTGAYSLDFPSTAGAATALSVPTTEDRNGFVAGTHAIATVAPSSATAVAVSDGYFVNIDPITGLLTPTTAPTAASMFYNLGPHLARAATKAGTGFFGHNTAGLDGGALYVDNSGTLNFGAVAEAATATSGLYTERTGTANWNVRASGEAGGSIAVASSSDRADAGTNSKSGFFEDNRTLNGVGGAIFLTNGGTINFITDVSVANATANASGVTTGAAGAVRIARHISEANAHTSGEAGFFTGNTSVLKDGGAIHAVDGILRFAASAVEARATAESRSDNASWSLWGGLGNIYTLLGDEHGDVDARAQATSVAYTGEFVDNTALAGFGGAIYTERGTLSFLADSAIAVANADSRWTGAGGWAYSRAYARAESRASNFENNLALSGGALYTEEGTLRFEAVGAVSATAVAAGNDYVGTQPIWGVYQPDDIRTIYAEARAYAALFTRNQATGDGTWHTNDAGKERITGYGGAIFNKDGDLRFISVLPMSATANALTPRNPFFETTYAEWVYGGGGMGGYSQSYADVAAAIFTQNTANVHGGAIYTDSGSLLFAGTTRFIQNRADMLQTGEGYGGALYNDDAEVTFIAATVASPGTGFLTPAGFSTFTENQAELGGAIYNDGVLAFYNASTAIEGVGRIAYRANWETVFRDPAHESDLWGGRFGGYYYDSVDSSNDRPLSNRAVHGGALFNTGLGEVLLAHVWMSYNIADLDGGAIHNDGGLLEIYGGRYAYNTAGDRGGALYNVNGNGNVLIIDGTGFDVMVGGQMRRGTRFEFNEAGTLGGAVYTGLGTEGEITNVEFVSNHALDEGGALWNAGTLVFTDVDFRNNATVSAVGGRGGAIFNTLSGEMSFTNATFHGNQTSQGVLNQGFGGAIFNDGGTVSILEGVFTQSRAFDGGAIYNLGGDMSLTNVNFSDNTAEVLGGAIYTENSTIAYDVTASRRSVFERNRGANNEYESIFFGGLRNYFDVNIAAGGRLDMYDPMRGAMGTRVDITQDGPGTWQLSGINNFLTGAVHFDIRQGRLHLHQHNYQVPLNPDFVHAVLLLGNGSFTLADGAALEVDGAIIDTTIISPVPILNPTGTAIIGNSSAGTSIVMEAGSNLIFNLSIADIRRSGALEPGVTDPIAALTLRADTITIASTVTTYLTGAPDINLDGTQTSAANWLDWFTIAGNELFLFDNWSQRFNPMSSGGVYQNGVPYMAQRRDDGSIDAFIVEYGWLKLETDQTPWTLYWTGAGSPSDIWNIGTTNWIGIAPAGVSSTVYRFYDLDHVRFADTYIYTVDGQPSGQNPRPVVNKRVTLAEDATGIINNTFRVSSLLVTGTNYVFDIEPNVTLFSQLSRDSLGNVVSLGNMDFGSARVNLGNNAAITAADGRVDFGTGSILDVGTGYSRINAAESIVFASGSIIHFDMAGAAVGQPAKLTLNSPTMQLLGSFRIQQMAGELVSAVDLGFGQRITLIQGNGAAAYAEPLIVLDRNNNPYITRRSATGVVYEFRRNGNNFELFGSAVVEGWNLHWTGRTNAIWDAVFENWLGHYNGDVLDPVRRTSQFGIGDFVAFADSYVDENGITQYVADNRKNITLGSIFNDEFKVFGMDVTGTGYEFTLPENITLTADYDIGFGTSRINMGGNTTIHADRNIFFSEGAVINVTDPGATISAGTQIGFIGDNDFYFDLTGPPGAEIEDVYLTLAGNVNMINSAAGALGGGLIYVRDDRGPAFNFVDPATGTGHIVLIKIEGSGKVTDTGTLMVWNGSEYLENTPQRSKALDADPIIGLGFGMDAVGNIVENELWLLAADAGANGDLYWLGREQTGSRAGEDNSIWNTALTNWTGRTDAGINVMTFLSGDRVFFDDRAENRFVNLSMLAEVASLKVLETGYTFDLTRGGRISAEGEVDFGEGTRIISDVGVVIRSDDGTINFGTGMLFDFDLTGAAANSTLLSLIGDVTVDEEEKIGSGSIRVTGIFDALYYNTSFEAGDVVTLVDAGSNENVTARTGDLDIAFYTQRRSTRQGDMMIGLGTDESESQLLLGFVDAGANSENLRWTGEEGRVWDVDDWNVNAARNWKGTIEEVLQNGTFLFEVDTFLNGDTVIFGDEVHASRRRVDIAEGGVRVHSMFVEGSNYIFDIREGGINAVGGGGELGTISLNDATLFFGIEYNETPSGEWVPRVTDGIHQITADAIAVDNTQVVLEYVNINPEIINQYGHMDFVILESREAPIVGEVNPFVYIEANPFYAGEFYLDNATTAGSGYGVLRLKKFFFEGWSHNTIEAAAALNVLRDMWAEDEVELFTALASHQSMAVDQLRGTELVANSAMIAMWRPWEITHQRLRTIRDETGWNSWGETYYRFGEVKGDSNARGYSLHRPGTMIGADYGTNRHWHAGFALGYAAPTIRNSNGKIDAGDVTLGVYSKYNFFDMGTVSTFLGYGRQDYKMRRDGFDGDVHWGRFTGDTAYGSIEYARVYDLGGVGAAMPLIAIDHQTAWTKGFTETGHWGQTVAATNLGRTMVRVGLDTKWDMDMFGSFDISTRLQAGFLVSGVTRSSVAAYFAKTNAEMQLRGTDMGRGLLNAGFTASGDYRARYNWFLDIDGFLTERMYALQAGLGVSTRW